MLDTGAAVVPAAHRGEEDVLGPPHHAFGHTGSSTCVEQVEVVGGAGHQCVPRWPRDCDRVLVLDGVEPFGHRARSVVELDEVLQLRHARQYAGDMRSELCFEDQRDEIGVVEQVAELLHDVAVVHVDRDGPGLETAEHRFDPLRAVEGVDADVLTRQHADVAQVVRDPVRALVELPVGQAAFAGDHRGPVRHGVGDGFEQVGEVELHAATLAIRAPRLFGRGGGSRGGPA